MRVMRRPRVAGPCQGSCRVRDRVIAFASKRLLSSARRRKVKRDRDTLDDSELREHLSGKASVADDDGDSYGLEDVAAYALRDSAASTPGAGTSRLVDDAILADAKWVGEAPLLPPDYDPLVMEAGAARRRPRAVRAARRRGRPVFMVAGPNASLEADQPGGDWYQELKAAGFEITSSGSDTFLQRRVRVSMAKGEVEDDEEGHAGPSGREATTAFTSSQQAAAGGGYQEEVVGRGLMASQLAGGMAACGTHGQLLELLEKAFPRWAHSGCRLLDAGSGGQVEAPTPHEAALALRRCADLAKRALRPGTPAMLDLARDQRVLGLVECLRVTPPRLPPDLADAAAISRTAFAAAVRYWRELPADLAEPSAPRRKARTPVWGPAGQGDQDVNPGRQEYGDFRQLAEQFSGPADAALEDNGAEEQAEDSAPLYNAAREQYRYAAADRLRHSAFVSATWALATLGGHVLFAEEMEALLKVARLESWTLTPGQLSDVTWALAASRHASPRARDVASSLLQRGGLAALPPRTLTSVLKSLASLGENAVPPALLYSLPPSWRVAAPQGDGKLKRHTPAVQEGQRPAAKTVGLKAFTGPQLASLAWSLAVLRQAGGEPFRALWRELSTRAAELRGNTPALVQAWQAGLSLRLEGGAPDAGTPGDGAAGGEAELWSAAQQAADLSARLLRGRTQSAYARQVANSVSRLGHLHVIEDNSTGYSVDVTIPRLKLAIEADGPSHFSRIDGRSALGATALKRRHLAALGWRVISVPMDQWERADSVKACDDMLSRAIEAAV